MNTEMGTERIDTVVIGAGQAGLATGYHLAQRGLPFVILDADERIGDHWRDRWHSLRLYSPAKFDSLPGRRFPARSWTWPNGREMGDYLEGYAASFKELLETTRWEKYGRRSGNEKCRDCMVHCGHEPSAVDATFSSWRGFRDTVVATVTGRL